MTLFVPSAYALKTRKDSYDVRTGAEWHVFVEMTTEDREETIYLHIVPRRDAYGHQITYPVTRMTTDPVFRTNIERFGNEYSWPDVPIQVRRAVLQDLGIEA